MPASERDRIRGLNDAELNRRARRAFGVTGDPATDDGDTFALIRRLRSTGHRISIEYDPTETRVTVTKIITNDDGDVVAEYSDTEHGRAVDPARLIVRASLTSRLQNPDRVRPGQGGSGPENDADPKPKGGRR